MIAKLNFVSITGPRGDIDRIVEEYLSRYEIHLEYAPSELKTVENLHPYVEQNKYREQINQMEELSAYIGKPDLEDVDMDISRAEEIVAELHGELTGKKEQIAAQSWKNFRTR